MYGLRIPDAVLLDQRLAPDAKLVYGLLAASGPSFNPSIRQISRSLGMSSKRVVPAIRALEARGVVTAGRPRARVREDGSRRFKEATRYTVHAGAKPDVWVRPHRVQSFLEATEGQSRVIALLLHVYERRAPTRGQLRTIRETAADLGISPASVKRARATLAGI